MFSPLIVDFGSHGSRLLLVGAHPAFADGAAIQVRMMAADCFENSQQMYRMIATQAGKLAP